MLSTRSFNPVPGSLEEDFNARIKYNFKLHILLCLKGVNWDRQDILQKIYMLEGYRHHKVAKHGRHWSHIHIKFAEEQQAENAVDFFNYLSSDLTAVCVDDLLRDWFSFEMRSGHSTLWTLAIVDILGTTPKSLNFLTENLLNYVFKDFGQPYLLPYTAALRETHVQVLFSSMTEALAACMALGQWYKLNQRTDNFVYRVRINPSNKEASLISNSGGTPEDAFRLDYFINHKPENNAVKGKWGKKNENSPYFKSNAYPNKVMERARKQDLSQERIQCPEMGMSRVNIRTPVMCVPVITPINETYDPGFIVAGQQVDEDLTATFLLHTACVEAIEPGTLPETSDPEMRGYSSRIYEGSERSGCSYQSISQHAVYQEGVEPLMNPTQAFNIPRPVPVQAIPHHSTVRHKNVYRGNSMVFERRKW